MNVTDLAAYLYRNYSFDFGDHPTASDLISVFREEFAYLAPAADEEFAVLYNSDGIDADPAGLFEPAPGSI